MSSQSIAAWASNKKLLKVMVAITTITAIVGIDFGPLTLFKIDADVFAAHHRID